MSRLEFEVTCPHCKTTLNRTTCPEAPEAAPEAGNVNFCAACGKLSMFTDSKNARKMTKEEEEEVKKDEAVSALASLWDKIIAPKLARRN